MYITTVAFRGHLEYLREACELIGCEFQPRQTTANWYGHSAGAAALSEGFRVKQLGRYDHVVRVKDMERAYEVGVIEHEDGTCDLIFDDWQGGFGLLKAIGTRAGKLLQSWAKVEAIAKLKQHGFRLTRETVLANGTLQLTLKG